MPRVLLEHTAGRSAASKQVPASEPPPAGSATVVEVYRMLQEEYGIDFTHYKPSTVTRRIERRLALARSADIISFLGGIR